MEVVVPLTTTCTSKIENTTSSERKIRFVIDYLIDLTFAKITCQLLKVYKCKHILWHGTKLLEV